MTPYYDDGTVTIYHGDAHDLYVFREESFRLIIDPPYGTSAYEWDVAPENGLLHELISRSNSAAVFGYPETLVAMCSDIRMVPDEWVVWWPTNKPSARTTDCGISW